MISNLADLVAPLPKAEFLALLRRRRLTLLRGAKGADPAALLNWETLRGVIARGALPPDHLRVMRQSQALAPSFFVTMGKVDLAKLEPLLDKGVSLILSYIEEFVPSLAALCARLRAETGELVRMSVVVTTGAGGALSVHYDNEDIFVLQLEGSKRWLIQGPPVLNPVKTMTVPPLPTGAPIFDEVLSQGDAMVVPAGNWHRCENAAERSLHLAVLFEPPNGWLALKPLVRQLLADEDFRVPLSRLESDAALAETEARLKERLTRMVAELSLRDYLAGGT
ncbi:MAG TPA: cupin domain-containing protein [Rhizomicrobium sp.]|nr:cupin domain-containing protein [Rhizomicrobium sp.]